MPEAENSDQKPEVVEAGDSSQNPSVTEPARVMRIGAMIRQLLEEVRQAPLDDASRARMRTIYETSVAELGNALSDELREELDRLTKPFEGDIPSDSELRIVHAQLVGWLEGLFHGMQAALFAQQMAAKQQLQDIRAELPAGITEPPTQPPGVYL